MATYQNNPPKDRRRNRPWKEPEPHENDTIQRLSERSYIRRGLKKASDYICNFARRKKESYFEIEKKRLRCKATENPQLHLKDCCIQWRAQGHNKCITCGRSLYGI